jgi:putative transposase
VFGEVADGAVRLNAWGDIVCLCWQAIADHFTNAQPDAFVIMPNHVHSIICLVGRASDVGARHAVPLHTVERFGRPVAGSIPTIVRSFKSAVTKRINDLRSTDGAPVWQRGFYERVIRDEAELDPIRQYIAGNPARWSGDTENLQAAGAPTAGCRPARTAGQSALRSSESRPGRSGNRTRRAGCG